MQRIRTSLAAAGSLVAAALVWMSPGVAGAAPPNDDFADAILLTGTSGVVDVTVVDATYEPGELTPRHPEVSPGHFTGSVWWKLVAPSDGSLAVTSTGDTGGFDQVAVSTGPTVDDQTYHTASSIAPTSRQSWHVLNLPVEAGETYYVSAEVREGDDEPDPRVGFQWSFDVPANDRFFEATVLQGTSGRVTGSTEHAVADPIYELSPGDVTPLLGSKDVWFQFYAPRPGTLTLSTEGSSFDTYLHVGTFTSTFVPVLNALAVNDDDGAGPHSRIVLPVERHEVEPEGTYMIALSGPDRAGGDYVLTYEYTPLAPEAVWHEQGDAAGVPWRAQQPGPAGTLDRIEGSLRERNDDDMYRVCLTAGTNFFARATGAADLQLFLFDANGRPLVANDDESLPGSNGATLSSFRPTRTGVYHLAVSATDNDPVSRIGEMFTNHKRGEVSPRGDAPILGWSSRGKGTSGDYSIVLRHVTACPA